MDGREPSPGARPGARPVAHGGIAFVAFSRPRQTQNRWHLPVLDSDERLFSGIAAVDLGDDAVLGSLEFTGVVEVFDLQLLAGVICPGIFDMTNWFAPSAIDLPDAGFWMTSTSANGLSAEAMRLGIQLHGAIHRVDLN